jgi:hypothetical protein
MFFPSPIAIPEHWQSHYRKLRTLLYLGILILSILLAINVFFPTIEQIFDFRSASASKNTILSPRSPDNTDRSNGKIGHDDTLVADTAVVGDFSLVKASVTLEKNSAVPETLDFSLRRSYQSFLYPTGTPVADFPQEDVYLVNGTYYALRNGTLFPFVSEAAYLSRFPKEYAKTDDATLLKRSPVSEEWLGFRVGSLLANAMGVFVVTSETEARPVGSAEIFLALGYDFRDVIQASEEELGVYKRGRIFLLGAAHPDGTVFLDQDDGSYYLVDQRTKRPLLPGTYRDFLVTDKHPIIVSTQASTQSAHCSLLPNIFSTKLSCTTPITALAPGFGNDFELRITNPETGIEINALSVSFETAMNQENLMTLLAKIKQRLLARFAGA